MVCNDNSALDEIEDLLNIIVQIVDTLDSSIKESGAKVLAANGSNSDLASLQKSFLEMRLDQRLVLRDNFVVQLAQSEVKEAVSHLVRCFLNKSKDIDFICQQVAPSLISTQCKDFLRKKAEAQSLRRS